MLVICFVLFEMKLLTAIFGATALSQVGARPERNVEMLIETKVNMSSCADVKLRYSDKELPRTIVTSFPGSGNTWLRHLIHMSTGYYTGSVYHDGKLVAQGFKGEYLPWNDNRTVGVKMHQYGIASKLSAQSGKKSHEVFPKTLLLIRNPLRAILSEFNRVNNRGHSHTGAADDLLFEDGTFHKFLKQQIPRWERSIGKWLNDYKGKVHIVCYERMKEDTMEVVKELVDFLEVPMARPRCVKRTKNSGGSFKRSSNHSDVTDMIKGEPELQHLSKLFIEGVGRSLRRHDLEDCTQYFA